MGGAKPVLDWGANPFHHAACVITTDELRQFRAGQVHRMALELPIDDHYMGGIVNKCFGQETGPLYWAVWTDQR